MVTGPDLEQHFQKGFLQGRVLHHAVIAQDIFDALIRRHIGQHIKYRG